MAKRTHNFNAGPSALPLPVLERAHAELLDFDGLGLSVMEMSHRSPEYGAVIEGAKAAITELYDVPDTHEVLFLQGGASLQFAMVPLNLGAGGAYVNTGTWSTKAIAEARTIHGDRGAVEVWSGAEGGFGGVAPGGAVFDVPGDAPYLHFTSNNTIYGTQWHHLPETSVPLVADLSSDFLSRPVDLSRFALVYAGAQKNAGPAGVTVVIADRALTRRFDGDPSTPRILRYVTQAEKGSMYNTPNTFGIYLVGLVAEWVREQGGLAAMAERNAARAARLYAAIDGHPGLEGHAEPASRSHMNVTFRVASSEAEASLLAEAARRGMIGLRGHRSVGGLRASIYNAVPDTALDALLDLLQAS